MLSSQLRVFLDHLQALFPDICHKFRPGGCVNKGITAFFQLTFPLLKRMAIIRLF